MMRNWVFGVLLSVAILAGSTGCVGYYAYDGRYGYAYGRQVATPPYVGVYAPTYAPGPYVGYRVDVGPLVAPVWGYWGPRPFGPYIYGPRLFGPHFPGPRFSPHGGGHASAPPFHGGGLPGGGGGHPGGGGGHPGSGGGPGGHH